MAGASTGARSAEGQGSTAGRQQRCTSRSAPEPGGAATDDLLCSSIVETVCTPENIPLSQGKCTSAGDTDRTARNMHVWRLNLVLGYWECQLASSVNIE